MNDEQHQTDQNHSIIIYRPLRCGDTISVSRISLKKKVQCVFAHLSEGEGVTVCHLRGVENKEDYEIAAHKIADKLDSNKDKEQPSEFYADCEEGADRRYRETFEEGEMDGSYEQI